MVDLFALRDLFFLFGRNEVEKAVPLIVLIYGCLCSGHRLDDIVVFELRDFEGGQGISEDSVGFGCGEDKLGLIVGEGCLGGMRGKDSTELFLLMLMFARDL